MRTESGKGIIESSWIAGSVDDSSENPASAFLGAGARALFKKTSVSNLSVGLPFDVVAQITGLSAEKIQEIADAMKAQ